MTDLAADPAHAALLDELRGELLAGRDLDALGARIRRSQAERRLVHAALSTGSASAWDHEPRRRGTESYVRGDFWTAIEHGHLPARDQRHP